MWGRSDMKSIRTKIIFFISVIMIAVVVAFLVTSTSRTNAILTDDSDRILLSSAEYYANIIDDSFRSTEQSVGTIYNYAIKRAETYSKFLTDSDQRDSYTYDVSELGKSIAENTRGAMAVYLRYNPDDFGATSGFWYTINLTDNSWQPSVPTDMSLYEKDDIEHVGWYYIPVNNGGAIWMDPYFNANLGVNMISYIIPYFYGNYTVGIIGMDISLDLLKESAAKVAVYNSGHAFMMEKNGNIIYHPDYPEGTDYNELRDRDKDYFGNILKAETDTANIHTGRDGAQEKIILKKLKNGMILGIYAPLTEINEPQRVLLAQQVIVSCVILVLAIIVGLFFVRSVTDPLKKMTAVAKKYENGNFDEEISVGGSDEVSTLSRSLQTMATSLKQQIEIANSANRAKSEFLASMSHEIRTPINAVLGMNEMILREAKDGDIRDYSMNIQDAGRTLLSLINTILDFSKIEDGKMEISPVIYDLAALINNLVNSISERAKSKELGFRVDIDETLPSRLLGDDVRISQIIMNLLTNAVKYTRVGEVVLSIKDGGRVNGVILLNVSVKDTGIGIKEEDIDRLGIAFERLDEQRNRNIEGTGLGMSIVNSLLAKMDSQLEIKSVYGKGSTFSFGIYQKIVDDHPIGNYEERMKAGGRCGTPVDVPKIKDVSVLVVDDYAMNLKVADNLLKLFGITPVCVQSGRDAIKEMDRNCFNIVFLDHMMPGMDGIETLGELKARGLIGRSTKMIALTANAVVGAKETYLAAGFDDYLSKPIEMNELKEILIKYLPKSNIEYFEDDAPAPDEEPDSEPFTEVGTAVDGTAILEFAPRRNSDNKPEKKKDTAGTFEERLMSEAGISLKTGMAFCGDMQSLYEDILSDYVNAAESKSKELDGYFYTKNWKDYRVLIHSLKSGSKTIGAEKLSEEAKRIEDAAKESDESFISEHHDEFIRAYKETASAAGRILREKNG